MSADIASELSERAQYTPFPTAKRIFVFIPSGRVWGHYQTTVELESQWKKWGGSAEYIYDPDRADECGIVVFPKEDSNPELARHILPFFERHGAEANVFCYCHQVKNFCRIDRAWLEAFYPTPEQTSGVPV